jgi:hypothetical protein
MTPELERRLQQRQQLIRPAAPQPDSAARHAARRDAERPARKREAARPAKRRRNAKRDAATREGPSRAKQAKPRKERRIRSAAACAQARSRR